MRSIFKGFNLFKAVLIIAMLFLLYFSVTGNG